VYAPPGGIWYAFDPSGLELLRRAIDHVATTRPTEVVAG